MEEISEDFNFDNIFKIMLNAMKLNRCHPDIPRDGKFVCQFLVMHGLFFAIFCLIIYSTVVFDIKNGNFTQACANLVISIIFCVVSFKYCVMLWYQNLFKSIMNEMKNDYNTAKSFSPTEQRIVHNYAKRGKKVVLSWLIMSIVASSLFVIKSFGLMFYYLIKGKFQFVPMLDITYPSPIDEMKNDPVVFIMLYLKFVYYAGYAMLMYTAMPPLGPVLMLHSCGQLELVEKRLLDIFNNDDTERTTIEKLKHIIKHLQNIYSFLELVNKCLHFMYEVTLKASSVLIPVAFYQIIQSYHDGDFRIEFITISLGAVALCSIPCYYGDQLMDMGENVRLALYMCGWENHLNKYKELRTTLLIIQLRSLRPVTIHTLFQTVCLTSLTDVYHQSYAIFNVLNASSH